MSGAASNAGDFFDIKRIRRLAELMSEQDLSEIDLQSGETRLRIRRKLEAEPQFVAVGGPPAHTSSPSRPVSESAPASAAVDDKTLVIKSPMIGTFYSASSPDSPPYVKVGDHVGPDTIVCIIEAMKVFNDIPAEVSGKILAVLVQNGDPVEFGQSLFRVQPGS